MMFCWVYWHGGAKYDELRWSMRSVVANYQGEVDIILVGDKPPWYTGKHIPVKRVGRCRNRGFRDSLNKLRVAIESPLVDDEFVWMMDDVYMNLPVTEAEIKQHYYYRTHSKNNLSNKKGNSWAKLKIETFKDLNKHNLPLRDYATHLPQFIEKNKFLEMATKFGLPDKLGIWEIYYGNMFEKAPKNSGPMLHRTLKKKKYSFYSNSKKKFINNGNHAWNEDLRKYLYLKFPEKILQEDYAPVPEPLNLESRVMLSTKTYDTKILLYHNNSSIWNRWANKVKVSLEDNFDVSVTLFGYRRSPQSHQAAKTNSKNNKYSIVYNDACVFPTKEFLDLHPVPEKVVFYVHGHLTSASFKIPDITSAIWSTEQRINSWVGFQDYRGINYYDRPNCIWLPTVEQIYYKEQIKKSTDKIKIIFAGRDDPLKNIESQLSAISRLSKDYEIHMFMDVGSNTRHVMHMLGILHKSHIHGVIAHSKFIDFLKYNSCILMNCSFTETLGLTSLEALSTGNITVTGRSVPINIPECTVDDIINPKEIEDKIKYCINNFKVISKSSLENINKIIEYRKEVFLTQFEKILRT